MNTLLRADSLKIVPSIFILRRIAMSENFLNEVLRWVYSSSSQIVVPRISASRARVMKLNNKTNFARLAFQLTTRQLFDKLYLLLLKIYEAKLAARC